MNDGIRGQILITISIILLGYIHNFPLVINMGIGSLIGTGIVLLYRDITNED